MRTYEKKTENRKVLVNRLVELTGEASRYTFVPRCAYEIGAFAVEKDGSLTVGDGADMGIIETLKAEGLIGEGHGTGAAEMAEPESQEPTDTATEEQGLLETEEAEPEETEAEMEEGMAAEPEMGAAPEERQEIPEAEDAGTDMPGMDEPEEEAPADGAADEPDQETPGIEEPEPAGMDGAEMDTAGTGDAEEAETAETEMADVEPEEMEGAGATEEGPDTTETLEPHGPETPEPQDGVQPSISFPMSKHTAESLVNLICMVYSRGSLLSKATTGEFHAAADFVDALTGQNFRTVKDVEAFVQAWEGEPLRGITFTEDKVTFDGFGAAEDPGTVQTYMKLAAAMNRMAVRQKRVQAREVDDSNEKYALRIWLVRLGMSGDEYKADRRNLMRNLSGHTAFRDEGAKERWTAKQQAKRDALRAAKAATGGAEAALTEEDGGTAQILEAGA